MGQRKTVRFPPNKTLVYQSIHVSLEEFVQALRVFWSIEVAAITLASLQLGAFHHTGHVQ